MPAGTIAARAALAVLLAFTSCSDTTGVRVDEPEPTRRQRRSAQAPEAAERDEVPDDVAALPFRQRVDAEVTVSEDEERWVISAPKGAEDGDYSELLLFDDRRPRRIVRAYPFPGVKPERLVLREGVVYCGGDGTQGLPDAVVCRVDRGTLDIIVRVYPADPDAPHLDGYPEAWTIADEHLQIRDLEVTADAVSVQSFDGTWTRLDPSTLRIVERGVARSE